LKTSIFNYYIHSLDNKKFIETIKNFLSIKKFHTIITLNPEIVVRSIKEPATKEFIKAADLCVADGIGLVAATKLINKFKLKKMPGIDLAWQMLGQKNLSFYFVGSKEIVINKAVQNIKAAFPNINIKGYCNGYFLSDQEKSIIENIKKTKPDIILVGLGFPKQELFLQTLSNELNHGIGMGVGGSFDVISGLKKRAPILWQKMGLEWLFRGIQEPSRILTRWSFMPKFLALCLKELFKTSG
jgi:N-acetylglucosaminyldiphosphoundecaprenol N-acetyl-beta-D-mannosaminyltransferase